MSKILHATVMVPTTSGRGPLLPLSVGSILSQTVADIEVFIMGDGVDEATRRLIHEMMRCDSRIRFFDNPKHERRGEPYRHAALAQARGRFVCYLCDRDLMMPNHLEVMGQLLQDADFAHTLISMMMPSGELQFAKAIDIADPADCRWIVQGWCSENGIPLSFGGHSMEMYRKLPHGWRTTPPQHHTDIYMWEQFLAQGQSRGRSGNVPTILYFAKYRRETWSVEQKREEIQRWSEQLAGPSWKEQLMQLVIDGLARDRLTKARQIRSLAAGVRP